jgi:ABC-type transport system involved in multi-copper enzyme maturation permease subunit
MTWILLAILVVLFSALVFFTTYDMNAPIPDVFSMIISTAASIEMLLLIILTGSSIGNEYGWGAIRQVMIKKGMRVEYVISKLLSLFIVAAIGLFICFVIGLILVLITSGINGSMNWDFMTFAYIGGILGKFGLALLSFLPYMLLSALFAFLGRSAITGVGVGLVFYFLEIGIISLLSMAVDWLADLPRYAIGPNVNLLLPASQFSRFFDSSGTVLQASMVLTVYCVVFTAISLYIFKKRDITV